MAGINYEISLSRIRVLNTRIQGRNIWFLILLSGIYKFAVDVEVTVAVAVPADVAFKTEN